MAAEGHDRDEMMREAARARGFRLVKSRRRKPGGDFGRYGLVDLQSGRECMGFSADGLTATPEEILAYLRGGEVASWKRSLIGVVDAAPRKKKREEPPQPEPVAAEPEPQPEADRKKVKEKKSSKKGGKSEDKKKEKKRKGEKVAPAPEPEEERAGEEREQELFIRPAAPRDAAAIAGLLGLDEAALAKSLRKGEEAPLVATRGEIVGIVAWTVYPTLQHGPRGRITALHVARQARRQGLGTRLLREVEQRLAAAGVTQLEIAIEIDFDAPTGFLRRVGLSRVTNGFMKDVGGAA